jgi:tetratricopeptide (TPR) repeat protein
MTSDAADAIAAFERGDLRRARKLAERELEQREVPQLQHLLGLIDCREGRVAEGVEWLQRASGAEPDNLAFRLMLVRALVDAGRAGEALAIAQPSGATSAAEIAMWHARAEAARALPDHSAAAEAWKVLCKARADDWRNWAHYGEALAGLERWAEAADALRQACALNPRELPIRQNLATALARAGLYDEAVDQLTSMLATSPADTGVRLMLSRLLADLGRHQESLTELDTASRLAPGGKSSGEAAQKLIWIALPEGKDPGKPASREDLHALRELALLLERTNRMEDLRGLLDDAEAAGISREALPYPAAASALRQGDAAEAGRLLALEDPDSDPVRQFRLKAKILEALGDSEGAFAAAEAMNRAVPDFDGWRARGLEYRRRVRLLASATTPDWAAELQPLDPGPRPSPAFLVGFPRSGTTLLDTFLMGHPETHVLEEFPMLRMAEGSLGKDAGRAGVGRGALERARVAYFTELDRHIEAGSTRFVIDKMPLNMLRLSLIYSLCPDATVIFAQRHPRDCVLSCFMQSFTLNDAMACFLTIEDSPDLYDAAMSAFTACREAVPVTVHTLAYEQLVDEPENALRPVIDFLGLDWRPELLDHRATAQARGAIITPSYDQVIQPLSKGPTGRWRRYERQLEPVLPTLLPWARRLGYVD